MKYPLINPKMLPMLPIEFESGNAETLLKSRFVADVAGFAVTYLLS